MKLLMHICCAPCAVFPVHELKKEGIQIEGYYYNPNIHPIEEFERRRDNVEKFSKSEDIQVNYSDAFMQEDWENFGESDEKRCNMCYSLRMNQIAAFAKENNYDAFTTSLLVSPYQKHDLIQKFGEEYAEKWGIPFYYRDFRTGFRQGRGMAKEHGYYRQKYCGCIRSK